MSDLHIRKEGRAGRVTLTRPKALNAMSHAMGLAIEEALDAWEVDDTVALVLIDAEGEKAFCAGGDIAAIHAEAARGVFGPTRTFWRDEYRLNARIRTYPKPVVTFLQGFTMGGGVGLGCHAQHRIVGDTSRIAMPECGIGLVPDAGGSFILSRAPGRLGEYLGVTGHRMGPACAILAGFADHYLPEDAWPDLVAELVGSGQTEAIVERSSDPGDSPLAARRDEIDALFDADRVAAIAARLDGQDGAFSDETRQALSRVSPLSAEVALRLIREVRAVDRIEQALELEYRCTHRLIEHGDLVEGIRAQVIDRDRTPRWRHAGFGDVSAEEIDFYLAPLGATEQGEST